MSEDVQIGGADFWNRDYKQEFCEAGIDMNEPKPNYSELNKVGLPCPVARSMV